MRLFKRISSTVLASVDKVISDVENHDAVIESMLQELKAARAQCKVRLSRVASDGQKMQEDFEHLQQQEQQWTERATQLSKENSEESQQKALACLERRKKVRDQLSQLNKRLADHKKMKQQLQDQLKTIDARFSEINNKRHLLQSQQSVAEANRVVAAVTSSGTTDIDATLDRWEVSIAKMDIDVGNANSFADNNIDDLTLEFEESESKQALLAELEALKNEDSEVKSPSNKTE